MECREHRHVDGCEVPGSWKEENGAGQRLARAADLMNDEDWDCYDKAGEV